MQPTPSEATRSEIEQAVTEWRAVRAERLAAEKVADAIKQRETQLKEFFVQAMLSQKYEGVVINERQTYVRTTEVPFAADRLAFEAYILETKDLSLLQFRPAVGAIREHMLAGETIPGIELVETYDLGDKKA
jgi:hypothetical protein